MPLDRRHFLSIFSAAMAVTVLPPQKAEAESADEIIARARRNADRFLQERGIQVRDNPNAGEDIWAHQPARKIIAYTGTEAPGTILIDHKNKRLYLINKNKTVTQFVIAVGREGAEIDGDQYLVTRKAEWPSWTPTTQMRRERPELASHYPGGDTNPMGAGAVYLGSSLYRIHGTNQPSLLGQNVSSGCIRMHNKDIQYLMTQVSIGAQVKIYKNGLDLTQTIAMPRSAPN